jgi:molybdate transport system permease protein
MTALPRSEALNRWTNVAAAAATGVAAAALVAFILLPMVAIFLRVSPSELWHQLHSQVALDALRISLETSLTALVFIVILGTPVAYVLGTRHFRGSVFVITLIELPMVLPPAVAGIGLLVAFGRTGLLGQELNALGIQIPFTKIAVVLAQMFVAMPFYVRQAIAAFASLDAQLLGASRTLGAGSARTFFRLGVPLAGQNLSAGAALAWGRALGEFGATIMFAGNMQGITQTLTLAIYSQFAGANLDSALAMSALLVAVSAGLLIGTRYLVRFRRRGSESPWLPLFR